MLMLGFDTSCTVLLSVLRVKLIIAIDKVLCVCVFVWGGVRCVYVWGVRCVCVCVLYGGDYSNTQSSNCMLKNMCVRS